MTSKEALCLVGGVAVLRRLALVLEEDADNAVQLRSDTDDEQPPAKDEPEHHRRGCTGRDQWPPAVRAEEPELAGAFLDLGVTAVGRPRAHPTLDGVRVVRDQGAECR